MMATLTPLRLLTAVPLCDGHDSAITTINLELVRHGIEVVYLGYHRSVRDVVRAAIQEDVRAVGLSSYNGGHLEFFTDVVRRLREEGAGTIGVFGGGGGTITREDAAIMIRRGVDKIFFPGTPLDEMTKWVQETYGRPAAGAIKKKIPRSTQKSRRDARPSDVQISAMLTAAQSKREPARAVKASRGAAAGLSGARGTGVAGGGAACVRVIGIAGPGGAGKTTLIDELVLRFLHADPAMRIAILCHDPSLIGRGALLGDRAAMIHSQNDRVFLRSFATRGQAGGLSEATGRCLDSLRRLGPRSRGGFDLVLVETVGIGQEAMPFGEGVVDTQILVMSPDYGSRLQLQKIVAMDAADVVVVNKSDLPGARTACNEIAQRLAANARGQRLVGTVAKRHRDSGVDELFSVLVERGIDTLVVS